MGLDGWIGLDIGGANIKVAFLPLRVQEPTESKSIPFALWKHPDRLGSTLAELFASYSKLRVGIAITMTGELADGYPNRQAGVESIVDAVELARASRSQIDEEATSTHRHAFPLGKPVFYGISQTSGDCGSRCNRWHDAESAKTNWTDIAAANWHAIACCLQHLPNLEQPLSGFLIDIGSTTTDIIPIRDGLPAASGLTDLTRLQANELIYAGVARTPICSLVQSLMIRSRPATIARELFATIEDAFLISGDIAEDDHRFDTADGRPATLAHARQRLAKMVCADAAPENFEVNPESNQRTSFLSTSELTSMAQQVISALRSEITASITRVVARNQDLPKRFFLSGQGDWFAKQILDKRFGLDAGLHNVADYVGKANSQSMAAFAVAKLAATELSSLVPTTASGTFECLSSRFSGSSSVSQTEIKRQLRVVKIGGSLLDRPSSPELIREWLKNQPENYTNLWIVGGGKIVDQIRRYDANFQLTESASHWLALDAMSLNLRLVRHWFPDWPLVDAWEAARQQFQRPTNGNLLLDFGRWLKRRPPEASQLPESWEITSDSCAAFLAQEVGGTHLLLLKSCPIGSEQSLAELAESGIVDNYFLQFASNIQHVQLVNLNADALPEFT